jgi:hypothetical protein
MVSKLAKDKSQQLPKVETIVEGGYDNGGLVAPFI